MNNFNLFRLKTSSVTRIPFQTYDNFTFIINDESFKTSRIVADLLSNKICKLHQYDPTLDFISIYTEERGDFHNFLNLINFKENRIPQSEIPFISEIIEKLESESIEIQEQERVVLTNDNIFDLISIHSKSPKFYSRNISCEIEYISSHFYELCQTRKDELKGLKDTYLENILNHPKLQVETEDQLISFLNKIVNSEPSYSYLYEYVNFSNVSIGKMKEFLFIFDQENLTRETWKRIAARLEHQIILPKVVKKKRKIESPLKSIQLFHEEDKPFKGIMNYLQNYFKENIYNEIDITSSSTYLDDDEYSAHNVIEYEDQNKEFCSKDIKNSWICFDFKKHKVIITDYTIRSFFGEENDEHPRSWMIEGSNDGDDWKMIDQQKDCSLLNGENKIHTFTIDKSRFAEFQLIRMKLTSENWSSTNCLDINCIEFYGRLF